MIGLLFDFILLRKSALRYCLKSQPEMIYYFIETQFMGRSYFIAFRNNLKQIDGKVKIIEAPLLLKKMDYDKNDKNEMFNSCKIEHVNCISMEEWSKL